MGLKIALAGNPNTGKTTLFNALTGSNQYVGNWPGVTVEKKEGKLKVDKEVTLTDLPGIYSLAPYTLEEKVARKYLLNEKPDAILNIIDGSNLERNLNLTTQLSELGIPMLIVVNMMDVVTKNGEALDLKKLSEATGCDAVEISALKNQGVDEAAKKVISIAKSKKKPNPKFKFAIDIEKALTDIENLALSSVQENKRWYALQLFERETDTIESLKIDKATLAKVEEIVSAVESTYDDTADSILIGERFNYISEIIHSCYKKRNKNKVSLSDKIDNIVTNRILALPIFAIVMIAVYYLSISTVGTMATDWVNDGLFGDGWFWFAQGREEFDAASESFDFASQRASQYLEAAEADGIIAFSETEEGSYEVLDTAAFESLVLPEVVVLDGDGVAIDEEVKADYSYADFEADAAVEEPETSDFGPWQDSIPVMLEGVLDSLSTADWLKGLILEGIVGGVGAVLGFLPQMAVLFLCLSLLEGCGYMARIAFIMDRVFRKFGLSGKSFIPILIGTGCGIPGVMASRTIESENDRRMTIMTTTFIPCGAKLPIIALISGALFGGAWWVAPSAYFVGIAAIIISGIILKKTKMFAGDPSPFVIELPAYHMPTLDSIVRVVWERLVSFAKKAGTIILLSSILLWFLQAFGFSNGSFGMVETNDSILAAIGNAIAWIFAPLGFGDWRAAVATITGLIAKENVVATFGVLYANEEVAENGYQIWETLRASYTPIAAYAFLVFNLLCAPCFAAIGAIRREMNNAKWFGFAIAYQCVFAYVIALIVYQLGGLLLGTIGFGFFTVVAIVLLIALIYLFFRKNPYENK